MQRRHFLGLSSAVALSPLMAGVVRAAGQPDFVLKAAPATAPLMGADKPATDIWAFGGSNPGPLIRIPRGKPVYVRLDNALAEPTSVHWHGIRIANPMDGVSGFTQAPVQPGESFDYRFTAPDAGTYWYHSHHRSWEQVARGLYGVLIVDEAAPATVEHDLLFVADDWRLDDNGQLEENFGMIGEAAHGGRLGNWLTVNGDTKPKLMVRAGSRVRLRCVSVANARVMAFAFPGLNPVIIALDGQPLATPEPIGDSLVLAPAQRADLLIDMPSEPGTELLIHEVSVGEPIDAATFAIAGPALRDKPLSSPLILPANPLSAFEPDLSNAEPVELLMQGGAMGSLAEASFGGKIFDMRTLAMEKGRVWAFNGIAGQPSDPLVQIKQGRTLTVNMINDTRWAHAMHMHGHHFRVVERNDKPVSGAPWRDTELVQPGEKVRISLVCDNPGKWLFHCHMLEHHMAGMGTWISVV